MRHKTARQLAEEENGMDVEEFFDYLIMISKVGVVKPKVLFESMCATAQNQLLKFCSDNNDTDAYNFYHSLI